MLIEIEFCLTTQGYLIFSNGSGKFAVFILKTCMHNRDGMCSNMAKQQDQQTVRSDRENAQNSSSSILTLFHTIIYKYCKIVIWFINNIKFVTKM